MEDQKFLAENARVYATHGVKKNQGMLAMVNCKMALAYTEGKGKDLHVVAYTYVDALINQGITIELPNFILDF